MNPEMDLAPKVRVAANLLRTFGNQDRCGAPWQRARCHQKTTVVTPQCPIDVGSSRPGRDVPVVRVVDIHRGRVDEPVPCFRGNISASGGKDWTGGVAARHAVLGF